MGGGALLGKGEKESCQRGVDGRVAVVGIRGRSPGGPLRERVGTPEPSTRNTDGGNSHPSHPTFCWSRFS